MSKPGNDLLLLHGEMRLCFDSERKGKVREEDMRERRAKSGGLTQSAIAPTRETFCEIQHRIFEVLNDPTPIQQQQQAKMPPKKAARPPQEVISLGPQVSDGRLVFGVARIFASFNDTFVHVTDLSYVHP
jgi:hypothetical protein